jgi:lipopolysaccharide export system permease protein
MLTKLDKYIIQEFWFPLLSALGIISGVWLGVDKFKEVFEIVARSIDGIGIGLIILGLEIPEILSITLPVSMLIGTFLSFQKLSGHSEIVAMRSSGISYRKIISPMLLLGSLASILTFSVSEFIVPFSKPLSKKFAADSLNKSSIEKSINSFNFVEKDKEGELKKIFYAREALSDELAGFLILNFQDGRLTEIHNAQKALWSEDDHGWKLIDVKSHYKNKKSQSKNLETNHEYFVKSSPATREIIKLSSKYQSMNFWELYKFISLHLIAKIDSSQLNESLTRFHKKFSYPFSCIFLTIIGSCIGITGRRKIINWGYIGMGLVVFVFFISQSFFDSLGDSGRLNPFLSAWMINLLLSVVAVYSFWKLSR